VIVPRGPSLATCSAAIVAALEADARARQNRAETALQRAERARQAARTAPAEDRAHACRLFIVAVLEAIGHDWLSKLRDLSETQFRRVQMAP
jgi:hypothetical protein